MSSEKDVDMLSSGAYVQPMPTTDQTLDALAIAYSLELRAERGPYPPGQWAIWAWCPLTETRADADIAGSGETVAHAIAAARKQLAEWEKNA